MDKALDGKFRIWAQPVGLGTRFNLCASVSFAKQEKRPD